MDRMLKSALPYNKLYLGLDGEYWNDTLNYLVVPVNHPTGDQSHCVLVAYVGQPDGGPWRIEIVTTKETVIVDDVLDAIAKILVIKESYLGR